MDELVILDFETTGLSPSYARVIEVGAIVVKNKKVVEQFSELMNPGCMIPHFITELTGITNQMVKGKPSPEDIMPKLKQFIGERPILAHNASFDQKFLLSEMQSINHSVENPFLCTMKLARRLILDAPNYKLTSLVSHLKIKTAVDHRAHRALNDVLCTLPVWLYVQQQVEKVIKMAPTLEVWQKLESLPKNKITDFLKKQQLTS